MHDEADHSSLYILAVKEPFEEIKLRKKKKEKNIRKMAMALAVNNFKAIKIAKAQLTIENKLPCLMR